MSKQSNFLQGSAAPHNISNAQKKAIKAYLTKTINIQVEQEGENYVITAPEFCPPKKDPHDSQEARNRLRRKLFPVKAKGVEGTEPITLEAQTEKQAEFLINNANIEIDGDLFRLILRKDLFLVIKETPRERQIRVKPHLTLKTTPSYSHEQPTTTQTISETTTGIDEEEGFEFITNGDTTRPSTEIDTTATTITTNSAGASAHGCLIS